MKAVKADNKQLEAEVARLTTSNEKLADDEGRWYSLARELENQMEVIKKVSDVCPQPTETTIRPCSFSLDGHSSGVSALCGLPAFPLTSNLQSDHLHLGAK